MASFMGKILNYSEQWFKEQGIWLAMTKFGIFDNINDERFGQNNSGKCFKWGQKKEVLPALGLLTLLTIHENRRANIFYSQSHNSIDCFKA